MAEVLVDTDVLVDHLRGHRPFAPGPDRISYSVVTRAELFAGNGTQEDPIRLLLGPFTEILVDRAIAEMGGAIRRDVSITLPDGLIAATAILGDLTLVTRNLADFKRVPGLKVRLPG